MTGPVEYPPRPDDTVLPDYRVRPDYTVLPVDRIRRVIARRMRAAVTELPHVTLHRSVPADALLAAQARAASAPQLPPGARITLTVLLVHIVARALREFPRMNGRTEQDEYRLYHQVNLGVAVALDEGLVAPVIHAADEKTLPELAVELGELTRRARAGDLGPADLADATFTMTNLGAYGVEFFTPIINPPQFGILGVGALVPSMRMVHGALRETRQLTLSLSFDHAAVDGAPAAQFLGVVAQHVETPVIRVRSQAEKVGQS